MQTRGRFVKDEDGGRLTFLREEGCQFDTLTLAAGKGAGGLPEFYVADAYILQRFEAFDNLLEAEQLFFGGGGVEGVGEELKAWLTVISSTS